MSCYCAIKAKISTSTLDKVPIQALQRSRFKKCACKVYWKSSSPDKKKTWSAYSANRTHHSPINHGFQICSGPPPPVYGVRKILKLVLFTARKPSEVAVTEDDITTDDDPCDSSDSRVEKDGAITVYNTDYCEDDEEDKDKDMLICQHGRRRSLEFDENYGGANKI